MDLRHNPFDISLPVILGHEAAGVVAAVGSAVQGFQVGDHVASHPVHPCGICPTCREGAGHLCDHLGHFGINMPGTHAEYYRVGQDRARLIPRDLPFSTAALAEPVCVCLEALAQARLSERAHLLILGDGPFGILMTRLAAKMLLERIVIAGMFDFRLSFALASTRVNLSGQSHPVQRRASL
jgi:threonine dehydrogenase-like Zn-dependent dehydrogenase